MIFELDTTSNCDCILGRSTNGYFSVPPHTPVIFIEGGTRTLLRLLVSDARRDTEDMLLHETAPQWVTDVVINKTMPKFNKLPFYLLPHPSCGIKPLRKDKLSASDMLQARKVIEHVYEKMMGSPSETSSQNAPSSGHERNNSEDRNNSRNNGSDKDEERTSIAEDKVELLCQDQVLDANMDLRTVKHFIWKCGGDLVLHYRPIK